MTIIRNPGSGWTKKIITEEKQYLVIDWANMMRRAFHVAGENKSLELLCFMLEKQKRLRPSAKLVVATEGNGKARRQKIFADYKATRKVNENFDSIYAKSLKILEMLSCIHIVAPEGEADDAIATFVEKTRKGKARITIISEDRDLWQLLEPSRVRILTTRRGTVTYENCYSFEGVNPENLAVKKALLGDTSDNVPRGVPRMKKVILVELARCGTTPGEAYRAARATQAIEGKYLDEVVKYREDIDRNYRLVKLRTNLRITRLQTNPDAEKLDAYLKSNGIHGVERYVINSLTRTT